MTPLRPLRRRSIAVLVALVAVACSGGDDNGNPAASANPATTSSAPTSSSASPSPVIVDLDAAGAQTIAAGPDADWITIANGSAWVANVGGGVRRYDVVSGAERGTTPVAGSICLAMDAGFDSLWAADCDRNVVVRIDTMTGQVLATIDPGIGALAEEASIAAGPSGVYVMSTGDVRKVARIDPATNIVAATFDAPPGAAAVRAGFDRLWFSRASSGELTSVDPTSGSPLSTTAVGAGARFLAVGEHAVWVLANTDGTVTRVDPSGNAVATIRVDSPGIDGGDIAVGGGYVWARVSDAVVTQIDEQTNQVVARYGHPSGSGSVAAIDHVAWLSAHDVSTVWRLPIP